MKIAVYWEQASWGGTDTHLLSLLSDWPDKDDHIVVIYNKGNKGFDRVFPELKRLPNIKFVETKSYLQIPQSINKVARRIIHLLAYAFRPLLFLVMVDRLKSVIRSGGSFDVLISTNGGYPAAWGCLSAILAAEKIGVPVRVLVVHHAATRNGVFMGWFEQLVDRAISRHVSAIVCVSYATRMTLIERRWLADNEQLFMKVIHNGIQSSNECIAESESTLSFREIIGISTEKILIGMVGRIEPYKGHEDVILAASRLRPEYLSRLHLVFVGTGEAEEIERLKRLGRAMGVSAQISFPGYVSGQIAKVISEMDLLVVATRSFEGFGLTLAEAMQVGTPILATHVGAIPEFVSEDVGKLVPPGDPEEIGLALADFFANRPVWEARAEVAREHIRKFNSKSMAKQYRNFLVERIASV